jgi:hypothetical protein
VRGGASAKRKAAIGAGFIRGGGSTQVVIADGFGDSYPEDGTGATDDCDTDAAEYFNGGYYTGADSHYFTDDSDIRAGDMEIIGTEIVPFERIRRITGYLVGTLSNFNNAKRAEERERVKHKM